MSIESGTHYWFTSSVFTVEPDEDEETNPRMYGRQLANWLRKRFLEIGYPVEKVFAEDWGWCVICQRIPYSLFIGCVNLRDYEYTSEGDPPPPNEALLWSAVPMAATPFFKYLLRRKADTSSCLAKFDAQLKAILESEPSIRLVDEADSKDWFVNRGFVSRLERARTNSLGQQQPAIVDSRSSLYRLWLWPLVVVGIALSSWVMVGLSLPRWLFVVPLTLVGAAVRLDLRLSGADQRPTDTVLKNVSGHGDFGLSRGSQIAIGLFALLFAFIMFTWASTAPGNFYFNRLPGAFCILIAGACLLPRRLRGYCGDFIACLVIAIAIWFLATSPWWESGKNPIAFAWVYGGLSIAYLLKRYTRRRPQQNS
jgi:hypothetical protein